jgi:hypothetical protein
VPEWLDAAYLGELQTSISERTRELDARFGAAKQAPTDDLDAEQRALIEGIAAASPHVHDAATRFGEAGEAIGIDDLLVAVDAQSSGLQALALAREQLLDLRGLIELAYSDERRIQSFVGAEVKTAAPDAAAIPLDELAPALIALQERNLERAARLATMLAESVPEVDAAVDGAGDAEPADQERLAAERARLEAADGLLALSESAMRGAAESLARVGSEEIAITQTQDRVETAVKGLEGLRRLFFTIVEHLRDTARREIEIADETESAGGLPTEQRAESFDPVAARQSDLADLTGRLAEALHEQALEGPAPGTEPVDPAVAEELAERLTRAAELVLNASGEMTAAAVALSGDDAEPDVDAIRSRQDEAVKQLAEAIAVLEPPPPPQPEEQDGEQGESQEQSQEASQEGQDGQSGEQEQPGEQAQAGEAEAAAQAEQSADPGQLLQSVRDREAERHRRNARGQSGYEPVDRDW